jgi:hypothetical protein
VNTLQLVALVALGISLVATVVMRMPRAGDRKRAKKLLDAADWLDEKSPEGAIVKVQGVVRMRDHGERFVSPISEERCVVLRVRVQVRHGVDPRAKLVEKLDIMPFMIEDADGKLLVEATHAVLDISPHKKSDKASPKKDQLLSELGYESASSSKSEFEETMVEVGATVTLAGKLAKDPERIVGDADAPIAIKVERVRADIEAEP